MHVTRIELTNWFRFRRASIALGPRAYAVEAELDGDAGRSNWVGKTALAEAIPFALFGWHRFQEGERAPGFEDAWIAEGEREGSVGLVLSNGVQIHRMRVRGQSTRISFTSQWGLGETGHGDRAQEAIDATVGLSADDYFSTAHVRQKACAQLVSARPAARMELIAAWLDFAKLDEAGKVVAARLTGFAKERDRLAAKVADLRVRLRDLGEEEHFGRRLRDVDDPAAFEAEAKVRVAEVERRARELGEARAERARWEGGEAARVRAAQAAQQLVEEERRLAEMPEVEPVDSKAAYERRQAARAKLVSAQRVARGEFDGRCPVREGFVCPARGEINAGVVEARVALEAAQREHSAAKTEDERMTSAASQADSDRRARDRQAERVAVLRSQAAEAGPNIDVRSPPPEVSLRDLRAAEEDARAGRGNLAALSRALVDLSRLRVDLESAETALAEVERRLTAARAARLVLGRGGAQRRVAEGACEAIARGANRRLAARGIDLRVGLSWRREGAELAPSCDACGTAFPRGRAAKACAVCGGPRGRAVQDRLDVSLSDRSGAAEDLAGLALQRAACAFLRHRRGAGWSTLVLDEPFGALDERHREAVARSLAAVREEDGVEQLLVVAHQPGVLETLPGRILIRARGGENTVEVIE